MLKTPSENDDIYDICIIGGGINGCGIARDAAGRGLKVVLCEQNDLASGTSSASSKLIHGGLRYLEHYEFKLVRESLREREVILKSVPHLVRPIEFILPHHPGLRPRWMLRIGLFLYDQLKGTSTLPRSRSIKLNHYLKPNYKFGFSYSDCWADDARLVIENAVDARRHGADIFTRSKCTAARRNEAEWGITVDQDGSIKQLRAKVLINASGPWLSQFNNECLDSSQIKQTKDKIKLVKGSHIIAPKWYSHDHAYLLQNDDKRIVFVIPYLNDYVIIGTTDQDFSGDPGKAEISKPEIEYLCEVVNDYFTHQLTHNDVVSTYAGVRPLYDDGSDKAQETTRDYKIKVDDLYPGSPLISIYGGKLTTYRKLAEAVLAEVDKFLPVSGYPWTATSRFESSQFDSDSIKIFTRLMEKQYNYLDPLLVKTYIGRYGSRIQELLKNIASTLDLGHHFGHQLYRAEVEYMIAHEWAVTTEDILWRRTKLGLKFSEAQVMELSHWIKSQ